jgi:hypothetical protein
MRKDFSATGRILEKLTRTAKGRGRFATEANYSFYEIS